jgi:hypothetical protein
LARSRLRLSEGRKEPGKHTVRSGEKEVKE